MSIAEIAGVSTLISTLRFAIDGSPSAHRVLKVHGSEALSELFSFEVTLEAEDEHLGEPPAIGARASLTIGASGRTRTVHGILRRFEEAESTAAWIATIAPAVYVLALREDCRVFQARSAPEVIRAVLEGAGFSGDDYRIALSGQYPPREYTVQYRESDWTFLRRVMESEGIASHFEAEDNREVLVFGDAPSAYPAMSEPETLPLRVGGSALRGGERATRFAMREELRAGRIELTGRDFRAPRANLESRAEDSAALPGVHDAPPSYDAADRGNRLARLRLEQEIARSAVATGASDCLGIRPGVVFTLADHARASLNRKWLVESVEHRLVAPEASDSSEPATYVNRFQSIASNVAYRTPPTTPRPSIGVQTAVVDGPPGQEIHCDEIGRVKVRFYWDRRGGDELQRSSWIRVGQAWAGAGNGAVFIPRVGDEVLVDFTGGDCDRPIIVGSVYNGANLPPLNLPEERTAAILRATSTPGGAGQSELRIEAGAGRERVYLQSHRDLDFRAGKDKSEEVVGDEQVEIGGNQSVRVGGDRSLDVAGQETIVVGEHLKIRVGGNKTENVIGKSGEAVAGEKTVEAERYRLTVHESSTTETAGDQVERAGGTRRIEAGELVELVCGEASITANPDGSITLVGKNVKVRVAGPVDIEGGKVSVKASGAVNLDAGGSVKVRGRGVSLN